MKVEEFNVNTLTHTGGTTSLFRRYFVKSNHTSANSTSTSPKSVALVITFGDKIVLSHA